MSVDLEVFLERSKLPSLGEWAQAISSEGFSLAFPEPVDITKHTGYLPAILGAEESGFEFFVSDLNEPDDLPEDVGEMLSTANASANFNCHGMDEILAATAAAAVLAHLTDGVVFDPQGGGVLRGQEAIARAKAELDAAARREADEVARHGRLPPAKWAEAFEQTLRRVNPDYRLSKDYRGRLVECVREDGTGLFLSQNCVKIHDNYRHCFALLLTRKRLSGSLYSPLILGSRFDHNSTIAHAYNRDYRTGRKWRVAPQEWHSEYRATVRGTQQWVETTAKSAEQILFPVYLSRLSQGADRVASLLRDAATFIEQWGISKETLKVPVREGTLATAFAEGFCLKTPPEDWNEGLVTYYNALRLADLHGFSGTRLLSHRQDAISACSDVAIGSKKYMEMPEDVRNAAIFVRYVEDFLTVCDELPRMVQTIENVRFHHPPISEKSTNPKRHWWQFW